MQKISAKVVQLIILRIRRTGKWCLCSFETWFKMARKKFVESSTSYLTDWATEILFFDGSWANEMSPL